MGLSGGMTDALSAKIMGEDMATRKVGYISTTKAKLDNACKTEPAQKEIACGLNPASSPIL